MEENKKETKPDEYELITNNPVGSIRIGDLTITSNTHDIYFIAGLISQMLKNPEVKEYLELYKTKLAKKEYIG
jgi:hypothetical protein